MLEPSPKPVARLVFGTSSRGLDRYFEGLKEMADIVGVYHVSIGTDQHVTPGSLPDYTHWVHLVASMLRGAFAAEEAGKIAGANYARIFRAAVGLSWSPPRHVF